MLGTNCCKAQVPNFGEATTSRLETLNGILKREVTGAPSFRNYLMSKYNTHVYMTKQYLTLSTIPYNSVYLLNSVLT